MGKIAKVYNDYKPKIVPPGIWIPISLTKKHPRIYSLHSSISKIVSFKPQLRMEVVGSSPLRLAEVGALKCSRLFWRHNFANYIQNHTMMHNLPWLNILLESRTLMSQMSIVWLTTFFPSDSIRHALLMSLIFFFWGGYVSITLWERSFMRPGWWILTW